MTVAREAPGAVWVALISYLSHFDELFCMEYIDLNDKSGRKEI
jgi:hypothetical protein